MQRESTIGTPLAERWRQPPRLLRPLFRQFAHPTGLLGRLAGRIMAKSDADDRWIVDLLQVRPDDRLLDVGCGPGVALELMAERVTSGLVVGVDPSDEMLRQAAARNEAVMRAGRVELKWGEVSALPCADEFFTKVCAIHTVYFWPSLEDGLRELHRVLAPDGRLIVAVRMQREHAGILEPSRYGLTESHLDEIVATLGEVGFREIGSQRRAIDRLTIVAISARR